MSNIPDFTAQVLEIQRQLEGQAAATSDDWKDSVKDRYYARYIDPYRQKIDLYIHGGSDMFGKGIDELLVFLDVQMQEMAKLTGLSDDLAFSCAAGDGHTGSVRDNYGNPIDVSGHEDVRNRDGIVHNKRFERDYWNESIHGSRPGQYSNEEINEIMKQRYNN